MLTFRLRFSRDVVLLAVGVTGCGPVLLFVVLGVMKGKGVTGVRVELGGTIGFDVRAVVVVGWVVEGATVVVVVVVFPNARSLAR